MIDIENETGMLRPARELGVVVLCNHMVFDEWCSVLNMRS